MSVPTPAHRVISTLLAERRDALRRSDTSEADRIRQDLDTLGISLAALESRRLELCTLRLALEAQDVFGALHPVIGLGSSLPLYHRLELGTGLVNEPVSPAPLPAAFAHLADLVNRVSMEFAFSGLATLAPGEGVLVELASAARAPDLEPLIRALDRGGAEADTVVIGLAASAIADSPSGAREIFSTAVSLGCRAAVTRFGAGSAGLLGLRGVPFDYLELDASLSRGVLFHPEVQAMIHATCILGQAHGATVVAHGVLDAEVLERLGALSVDAADGPAVAPAVTLLPSARELPAKVRP